MLFRSSSLCSPASWPAQPAAGPAHLPPLSSSSSTEGGECGRRARAPPRHATCSPACLPLPSSSGWPGTTPRPPPFSLTLPRFFLSSPSLSLSRPNTTIAAVRHSSRHRPPLAPPLSSGAPPRPPLPPHRSTGLRKPCIASHVAVPLLGHRRSSPSNRELPDVPEPANHPCSSAVSH